MTRVASSPEDTATNKAIVRLERELENLHIKIRSIESSISTMKGNIESNTSNISSKASQSDLDALGVRVTALEDE